MAITVLPLSGTFTCDATHSSFQFAVIHMKVVTFRASFDDVEATLTADEAGVRLRGTARASSLSIRNPAGFRTHMLDDAEFFDATAHPVIEFRSDSVQISSDGAAWVEGALVIKGISRPVTATGAFHPPVEDAFGSVRAGLRLEATVDRRDWAMTWQAPLPGGGEAVSWDVDLLVDLSFVRSPD